LGVFDGSKIGVTISGDAGPLERAFKEATRVAKAEQREQARAERTWLSAQNRAQAQAARERAMMQARWSKAESRAQVAAAQERIAAQRVAAQQSARIEAQAAAAREAAMARTRQRVAALGAGAVRAGRNLALVGTVAAAAFANIGVDELTEATKANALTAAGIKSTGGAANVTAKDITRLSEAKLKMSGIDDQVVQGGANILLTFTKVRNEVGAGNKVFDRAVQSALDLSVRGFGSVESSSKMLGKALNDPVKGISALSRAGVTFTKQQKDQIKALVKSGQTLKAQKLIMREVEVQVGGSAKAFGDLLPQRIARAREQFAGIAADVTEKFIPAFEDGLGWVEKNIAVFGRWAKTDKGQASIRNLEATLRDTVSVGMEVARGIGHITGALAANRAVVLPAVAGYVAMSVAFRGLSAARDGAKAIGLLGGAVKLSPIGLAVSAVGALTTGLTALHLRNRRDVASARESAAARREQAASLWSVKDAQNALANAGLGKAEAGLGVESAQGAFKTAQRDFGKGSLEARQAYISLRRAKIALTEATKEEGKVEDKTARDRKAGMNAAMSASRDLRREEELRRRGVIGGSERAELRKLTAAHKENLETVKTAQSKGWSAIESKQRDTAARMERRHHQAAVRMAKATGRSVEDTKRSISSIGAVRPDLGGLISSIVSKFSSMSETIRKSVGKIKIPIEAVVNLFGGKGDGFGFGGLPKGVNKALGVASGLASKFGLRISAGRYDHSKYTKSGNISNHYLGRALDFAGPPAGMRAFALAASKLPHSELLYDPLGGSYYEGGHTDHVHFALQRGGYVPGVGEGDKVPALLEPGEGVINKRAVSALGGPHAIHRINRAVPRFQHGGVIDALGRASGHITSAQALGFAKDSAASTPAFKAKRAALNRARLQKLVMLRQQAIEVKRKMRGPANKVRDLEKQLSRAGKEGKPSIAKRLKSAKGTLAPLVKRLNSLNAQIVKYGGSPESVDQDILGLAGDIVSDETVEETDGAFGSDGSDGSVPGGGNEDLQAIVDQERERARVATEQARLSEIALSTLGGPNDIRTGTGNTTIINTLHPGDPRTLEAVQRASTQGSTLGSPGMRNYYPIRAV